MRIVGQLEGTVRGRFFTFIGVSALWITLSAAAGGVPARAQSSGPAASPAATKGLEIVILGSGSPIPLADRQGPSLAVVVNGKAYIVDVGTGIARQANSAYQRGTSALRPADLDIAFLTHLHSDHTLGLPDLILTPWILGRTKPLRLFGPSGTKAMAAHIEKAYQEDVRIRTTGLEGNNTTGYKVEAQDIQPGRVYQDENISVQAFLVRHGSWEEALGYRFDAGGKSVVISGDTAPADSVAGACDGCDALIHEVYSGTGVNPSKPMMTEAQWMKYEAAFHTSAKELGEIAAKGRPKMLILTHWTLLGNAKPEDMVREIQAAYKGPIIVARDLDLITP